ncbi:hypothetical protein BGX20_003027, partial [Mortierella sp. AD010]
MTTRVYLGHLSRDASDRDVEGLFKGYGRIREVTLKNGFGFVEFQEMKDAEDAVYDFNGKEFMGEKLVVELARGDRRRDERREERDDRRFGPPERTEFRIIVENLAHGVSWQVRKPFVSTSQFSLGKRGPALVVATFGEEKNEMVMIKIKEKNDERENGPPALACCLERGPYHDIKDLMRKAGQVTFADLSKDRDDEGVVEFSSERDVQNALKTLDGENLRGKPVALRLFDPSRDSVPRDLGRGGGGGRDLDRYDGRRNRDYNDRDRRDRGGRRGRSRSRSRDRGGRRSRSRERRRSRSRDRGDRTDRDHNRDRERGGGRDRDRDRNSGRGNGGRRGSRSPASSKSPVRRGRSRSAGR